MNLRRLSVLLRKEFTQGFNSFMFILAIVLPVVLTLVVSLLFGTFLTNRVRIGVFDEGASAFENEAGALESVDLTKYASEEELRTAVELGREDIGLTLPAGFDAALATGTETELGVLVNGESQLKHRTLGLTSIVGVMRAISGEEAPVTITTTTLGDGEALPWEVRLLPFVVMIAVLFGGLMVPATSLVEERVKRTFTAVTTTPTGVAEVFTAKAMTGIIVSTIMAIFILVMNRALGSQPLLLIGVLALGAAFSAVLGLLLGEFSRDINSLFATIKGLGIFLYAPALVYMFPAIPAWIGRIFPTYYLIQPVIDIVQEGAQFADVLPNLLILIALTLGLAGIVGLITRRRMRMV